jgi:hypothetical protein
MVGEHLPPIEVQAIIPGMVGEQPYRVHPLEPLLAAAEADGRGQVALELRVPLALAFAATGRPHHARHTLAAALASAQHTNAQHILIAEGEALAPCCAPPCPL